MSKDTKQRAGDGPDVLATAVVVVAGLLAWYAARWVWRHPVAALSLTYSIVAYVYFGATGLIVLWVVVGCALLTWRVVGEGSFDRSVAWRVRRSLRGWWVYGRRWRAAVTLADLGDVYDSDRLVPTLRQVGANSYKDRLTVRMLAGQHPSDYARQADTLAHTFGQLACRVRVAQPGWVYLDFTRRDLLAKPIPAFPVPDNTDLSALPVARQEDGEPWLLRILGRHLLVAGVTGAGKGSVLQSIIRACAPAIRSGLVALYGIDPKGGMELAAAGAEALYTELVRDDPEDQVRLLEDLVGVMRERAHRLAGVTRLHEPTTDDPLLVLVIDELAALTSYRPRDRDGRELYGRIDMAINLLLSQGRAVGIIVVTALQDPRKEVLPNRDLFPTRIALRLVEAEATDMVLGPGARERGADCSLINPDLPGVAWVWSDGEPEPIRVRFSYPTDDDIAYLVEHYRPLQPGAVDATAEVAA